MLFPLLVRCLLLLLLPASVSFAAPLEPVTLQLKWRHQFQFAGYYVALHRGFYRDEGLAVTFREGGPGISPTDEVMAGHADFGVGGGDLVYQWLQDRPVVALASIFQHSPTVLLTLKSSGLSSPHDLAGKRIAMLVGGLPDAEIAAMFTDEGVALTSLEMVENSGDIAGLLERRVDAMFGYLTNEPYQLDKEGVAFNLLRPISYGIDFYGDTLFTSQRQLHDHPGRVAAFLRASLRGWSWAMKHPEETIDLMLEHYPVERSREHLLFEAMKTRELMLPEIVEIGHMNRGRWRAMADTFVRLGMAPAGKSLKGFLYEPEKPVTPAWLWWALGFTAGLILLALLISTVLAVFNRRLRAEVAARTASLSREVEKRQAAEKRLAQQNELLERRVEKRTRNLAEEVSDHRRTIAKLSETSARLREARKAAEAANEAKSIFLATMSHEIRTPLNAIVGINQLLQQSALDKQQKTWLQTQHRSALMLQGIISNVLDFSRIEAGALELESVNFDLRQVVNNTCELIQPELEMKGLKLEVTMADELPGCLVGDPLRLGQILLNLASNAVKFTEKGKVTIDVRVVRSDDESAVVECIVEDSGIGICAADREEIFRPFAQLDASFARRFGGAGLGLAITRQLLQRMDSELRCESTPGEGSRFSFAVELGHCAVSRRVDTPAAAKIEPLPQLAESHVLLVEDDPVNQMVAEKLLEALGVGNIIVASSGLQALEKSGWHRYDLILMDLQMPDLDGFRTTEKIRARYKDKTPIVAMTASTVSGTKQRCLDAGMNDYISKPVDVEQLREILLRWVNNKPDTADSEKEIAEKLRLLGESLGEAPVRELLQNAVKNLATQKAELLDLIRAGEIPAAQKLAHRMKGNTVIYGSSRMENLLRSIEKHENGEGEEFDALVEQLLVEADVALRAMERMLSPET